MFGRPFLRRADRPAVKIPPRKRKREIYEEDSDNNTDDDYARNGHIVVRGRLDDAVNTTMEGDNGDEEYYPGVDENNDLLNELEDLRNDQLSNAMGEINPSTLGTANALNTIGVIDDSHRLTRSQSFNKGLGLQGPAMLKLLDENGRPYPGVYDNPLLDQYSGDKPPLNGSQNYGKKHGKKRRALHSAQIDPVAEELSRGPERVNSRILNPGSKGVRFENIDSTTPVTIQEFEDSDQSNDKDFHDEGDVDVDLGESDKENSQPQLQDKEQTVVRLPNLG